MLCHRGRKSEQIPPFKLQKYPKTFSDLEEILRNRSGQSRNSRINIWSRFIDQQLAISGSFPNGFEGFLQLLGRRRRQLRRRPPPSSSGDSVAGFVVFVVAFGGGAVAVAQFQLQCSAVEAEAAAYAKQQQPANIKTRRGVPQWSELEFHPRSAKSPPPPRRKFVEKLQLFVLERATLDQPATITTTTAGHRCPSENPVVVTPTTRNLLHHCRPQPQDSAAVFNSKQ